MATYDFIVVGGGSAGAVVAARLSEDGTRTVLLLEAGDAPAPDAWPVALSTAGSPVLDGYNWDHVARLRSSGAGASAAFAYPMAKVLGGGSAINGSVAMQGRPEDFDHWAASGNDWWRWEEVRSWLPALDRIAGGERNNTGSTAFKEPAATLANAFFAACVSRNFPMIDTAVESAPGVGPVPRNVISGRRLSTAELYLRGARQRRNLTIRGGCEVTRLLVDTGRVATRASGVEMRTHAGLGTIRGENIVLCAGAIGSPSILLRSGIGPARNCERAGVPVTVDLPGVGRNLIDHPAIGLWTIPPATDGNVADDAHQGVLQLSSTGSATSCDLQIFLLAAASTTSFPELQRLVGTMSVNGLSVVLTTPSSTGHLELQPASGMPRIFLNCLDTAQDQQAMKRGVRTAWELMHDAHLVGLMGSPVTCNSRVIRSDQMLERMLRTTVRASWHPVGTLRMGRDDDEFAVASQHGRLRGIENVHVADASLMPTIPRVPTNLTCMLIGERIADHLCRCYSSAGKKHEVQRDAAH